MYGVHYCTLYTYNLGGLAGGLAESVGQAFILLLYHGFHFSPAKLLLLLLLYQKESCNARTYSELQQRCGFAPLFAIEALGQFTNSASLQLASCNSLPIQRNSSTTRTHSRATHGASYQRFNWATRLALFTGSRKFLRVMFFAGTFFALRIIEINTVQ